MYVVRLSNEDMLLTKPSKYLDVISFLVVTFQSSYWSVCFRSGSVGIVSWFHASSIPMDVRIFLKVAGHVEVNCDSFSNE